MDKALVNRSLVYIAMIIGGIIFVLSYSPTSCIWKAVLAEASSEGYLGMKGVGCVFRNRLEKGMNIGSKGLKRKDLKQFLEREGKEQERKAKAIYKEVFIKKCPDITGGALYFEHIEKYGKQSYHINKTVKIGNHTYFKGE